MNIADFFAAQQAGVTPTPNLSLGNMLEERMRLAGMPEASAWVLRPHIGFRGSMDYAVGQGAPNIRPIGSAYGGALTTPDLMMRRWVMDNGRPENVNNPTFGGR